MAQVEAKLDAFLTNDTVVSCGDVEHAGLDEDAAVELAHSLSLSGDLTPPSDTWGTQVRHTVWSTFVVAASTPRFRSRPFK